MFMNYEKELEDRTILVVDDELDILDSVEEVLYMCDVKKVCDYSIALQLLLGYTWDAVILDIMGVDGFKLLKTSVLRGFPTIMLTAHAFTPDALKKSIQLGALSFLPKEKILLLPAFLTDAMMDKSEFVWNNLFGKLGQFFDRQFGLNWKDRDSFFREFEKEIREKSHEEL